MKATGRHLVRGLLVALGLHPFFATSLAAQSHGRAVGRGKNGASPGNSGAAHSSPLLVPSENNQTVYDKTLNVTWLANGNLAAMSKYNVKGINADGSMGYDAAVAWVRALNDSNYLGHNTWTIPVTPKLDSTCAKIGPNNNSFGFGCRSSTLGSLYYTGLGLIAPNTAVRMPPSTVMSFKDFQPYLYWAEPLSGHDGVDGSRNTRGFVSFSFNAGYKGSNVLPNFLYVIPMLDKKPSAPIPKGQVVYDSAQGVTWLADANLAAKQTFGVDSINPDGAMDHATAVKWVKAMNAYNKGKGYLGQTTWRLPPADTADGSCSQRNFAFHCVGSPLGKLFYGLLRKGDGESVVTTPDVAVGPFHNIQPYLYWSCLGATGRMTCDNQPAAPNFQFSFSFGNGFQGTDFLKNDLYLMVYYPGPPPATSPKCPPGKCKKAM